MEEITLHNYEAFLLDYSEGSLTPVQVEQLKAFVISHPELAIDLNDIGFVSLSTDKVVFEDKEILKKEVGDEELIINYLEGGLSISDKFLFEERLKENSQLADEVELYRKTFLTADTADKLDKAALYRTADDLLLQDEALNYLEAHLPFENITIGNDLSKEAGDEVLAYSKTILKPELEIVFPDKSRLKRGRVVPLFSTANVLRAAAALFLVLGLSVVFYFSSRQDDTTVIAVHKGIDSPLRKNETVIVPLNTTAEIRKPVIALKGKNVPSAIQKNKQSAIENKLNKESSPTEVIVENTTEVEPLVATKTVDSTAFQSLAQKNISLPDSFISRRLYAKLEEIREVEDVSEVVFEEEKKGFWSRAVEVIRQANKLGLKAVDAEEDEKNRMRISFNSFSVEKH